MVLVDTSIWINHFRAHDSRLSTMLENSLVLCHPVIIGELALGSMQNRVAILGFLRHLRMAVRADDDEVFDLIERHALFGTGIGFSDAHILASTLLTPNTKIWTQDKRLSVQAARLGLRVYDQ